jgi:DNA-binding response OmpR family regulator
MNKDKNNLDTKPQILLIEHDPALSQVMQVSLEQTGVKVEAVSEYNKALQILQRKPPDVFILDFDLHGGDPGKLIRAYREYATGKNNMVVISTTNRLEDAWRQEHKPDSVIYKPFDIRYLIRLISSRINNYQFYHI